MARTRYFFGIYEMSSSPIALYESPCAGYVNGVPTIPEPIVLETYARLITGGLAVTLDNDAVQTCVTGGKKKKEKTKSSAMTIQN